MKQIPANTLCTSLPPLRSWYLGPRGRPEVSLRVTALTVPQLIDRQSDLGATEKSTVGAGTELNAPKLRDSSVNLMKKGFFCGVFSRQN